MRIYTLGTSHGDSTFSRFNSSTAYETNDGTIYLVDAGAPCEALLRRKGLSVFDVKTTFITHMHDDHAGGLSGLLKQVRKYIAFRKEPMTLFLPEENAVSPLKAWMSAMHEDIDDSSVIIKTVNDGTIYDDDSLSVFAIRTCHLRTRGRTEGEPCSFAYVLYFKKENIKILHTGDLWCDFSDFPKIAQTEHFDACLCEATHYKNTDALPIFMRSRFDKLIFIHINENWHNRIGRAWEVNRGEKRLLDECKNLPYKVYIAHDGDEFVF